MRLFFGPETLDRLLVHLPDTDRAALAAKIRVYTALRSLQDRVFDLRAAAGSGSAAGALG